MTPLKELFQYLDELPGRAPLDELQQRMSHCEISCEDVATFIHYSDHTYHREPIRSGPHYQAWIMCWRNGQRSPIHDHQGSSCAVRVLEGTMTETLFERAPNDHIKAVFSRDFQPGEICGGEDSDIHQVSNLQADNANLITLHVYSPPLVYMGTYSLDSTRREKELMYMEITDAAGI